MHADTNVDDMDESEIEKAREEVGLDDRQNS